MKQGSEPAGQGRKLGYLVAVGTLGALMLRLYQLGRPCLWLDEGLVFHEISRAGYMFRNVTEPQTQPLYNILTFFVCHQFGFSESCLRIVSALAGAATVPIAYALFKKSVPRSNALLGAGLLAIHPLHVWYSQEARPYALWTCLLALAWLSLVEWLNRARDGRSVGASAWRLTGWMIASFWAHLLSAVYFAAFGAFVHSQTGSGARARRLAQYAGFCAAALSTYLIAVGYLSRVTGARLGSGIRAGVLDLFYSVYSFLVGRSFGPSLSDLRTMRANHHFDWWDVVGASSNWMLVPALAAGGWLWVGGARALRARAPGTMRAWATSALLAAATVFALSTLPGKAFNVRYLLPLLIPFLMVLAAGLEAAWRSKSLLRRSAVAGYAAASLVSLQQNFYADHYLKADFRSLVAYLRAVQAPGEQAVIFQEGATLLAEYYWPEKPAGGVVEVKRGMDADALLARLDPQARRVSLVTGDRNPSEAVASAFRERLLAGFGKECAPVARFANLEAREFCRRSPR